MQAFPQGEQFFRADLRRRHHLHLVRALAGARLGQGIEALGKQVPVASSQ
jgi:hypothetical protein